MIEQSAHSHRIVDNESTGEKIPDVLLQKNIIEAGLEEIGLMDFSISEKVKTVDPQEFSRQITLGISGGMPIALATFLSLSPETIPTYEDTTPITSLLILPESDGLGIYVDPTNNSLWADNFFVLNGSVIQPIHTTEFIPVDGFLPQYTSLDKSLGDWHESPGMKRLHDLEDKWKMKQLLKEAGIAVPDGIFVQQSDDSLAKQVYDFAREQGKDGIVIKGNMAHMGEKVQLFTADETYNAIDYALDLQDEGYDCIVEERIIPYPIPLLESDPTHPSTTTIDWNLRVLTSVGTDPRNIGAEVRYNRFSGTPINTSQGALYKSAQILQNYVPESILQNMHDAAIAASAVVYEAVQPAADELLDYVGHDIIIDRSGTPYFLEVNTEGVGGIEDLCGFDKQPVSSMRDTYLEVNRYALEQRFLSRREKPEQLNKLPLGFYDEYSLASAHIQMGNYAVAKGILERLIPTHPYQEISLALGLGAIANRTKNTELQREILESAYQGNQGSLHLLEPLIAVLMSQKKYVQALLYIEKEYKPLNKPVKDIIFFRAILELMISQDLAHTKNFIRSYQDNLFSWTNEDISLEKIFPEIRELFKDDQISEVG